MKEQKYFLNFGPIRKCLISVKIELSGQRICQIQSMFKQNLLKHIETYMLYLLLSTHDRN